MDPRIEQYYFDEAKKGNILGVEKLQQYARDQKLFVPTVKALRRLRHTLRYLAVHSRWVTPAVYVGAPVLKLGCIQMDMMTFKENLKVANKNRFYILVAVDSLSQKAHAIAFPNKSQASWDSGVKQFIALFGCVRSFITDRDSAVSGEAYQARLYKEKQIKWYHLRSRSKAYLAERYIRFLRSRLSQALKLNKKGDNNWLQHLDYIIKTANEKLCKGTRMRRCDITKANAHKVLQQRFKTKDFSSLFNTGQISNFSKQMTKEIGFEFKPGDKVLVSTSANYTLRKGAFVKKSGEGNFSSKVFTIDRPYLKVSEEGHYVMAYQLLELDGMFYYSDLSPAYFAEETKEEISQTKKKTLKETAAAKTKRQIRE